MQEFHVICITYYTAETPNGNATTRDATAELFNAAAWIPRI